MADLALDGREMLSINPHTRHDLMAILVARPPQTRTAQVPPYSRKFHRSFNCAVWRLLAELDLLHRDLQMWQAGAVVADRLAAVAAAASPARGVAPEAEPRAAASGQAIVSHRGGESNGGGGAATDAAAAIDAAAVSTPQRGPLRPKNSSSRRSADAGKGGGPAGSASEDDFDEPLPVGAGVGSEAERDVL